MVSNVSLNNLNNIQSTPAFKGENKAVTSPVKQEQKEDSFASSVKSSAGFVALMQGIPLINFLRNTKKLQGSIKPNPLVNQIARNNIAAKNALLPGEGNFIKRFVKYAIQAEKTNDALSYVKSATKTEAKAAKLAEKAKQFAAEGTKSAKKIAKAESKAAKVAKEAIKKADDAQDMIKNINNFGKVASKAGSKVSNLTKVKNFMKSSGLGLQIVMSGISEFAFEVIPTFKELGAEKGFKQLGKSAIRVLGDVAGYAGAQAVGAAIGTALFAGVPVVGPFLGAALGFGFGMVGSYLAGKVTEKITGPSERTLAEQAKQDAVAKNNPFEEIHASVQNAGKLDEIQTLGYSDAFADKEIKKEPTILKSTTA